MVIVKQKGGEGLYQGAMYLRGMEEEFKNSDWMLFNQTSKSLITNIHDSCVSPMTRSPVSIGHAITFGSTLLKVYQLNQKVIGVWRDKAHLPEITWAFERQSKMVCVIIDKNGYKNYLMEKVWMIFGVR